MLILFLKPNLLMLSLFFQTKSDLWWAFFPNQIWLMVSLFLSNQICFMLSLFFQTRSALCLACFSKPNRIFGKPVFYQTKSDLWWANFFQTKSVLRLACLPVKSQPGTCGTACRFRRWISTSENNSKRWRENNHTKCPRKFRILESQKITLSGGLWLHWKTCQSEF